MRNAGGADPSRSGYVGKVWPVLLAAGLAGGLLWILQAAVMGIEFPSVRGDLEFRGRHFPQVNVRYKGNGTFVQARGSLKRSYKVDLDEFARESTGSSRRFAGDGPSRHISWTWQTPAKRKTQVSSYAG